MSRLVWQPCYRYRPLWLSRCWAQHSACATAGVAATCAAAARGRRWRPRLSWWWVNCARAPIQSAHSASRPTRPAARLPLPCAVAARARLGADVTAGLLAAARSSALPAYWERLAVCWQLGSDHGLAIASLMRAAQRDVAERQRFSARVSAGMAGARASAAILAILPLLGVLLGQLIGARPLSFLLTGRVGGWLLVVGLTLACAGLLWSDRITDRPVL